MNQAILITAFQGFDQLSKLIDQFDNHFNIYLFIDRKTDLPEKIKQKFLSRDNVKYVGQDYIVNWGGINQLKSCLLLSDIALRDDQNVFFHHISGQDFPIKNNDYFKELIATKEKRRTDYLEYFKMPSPKLENGGLERLEYYNFYDLFNAKKYQYVITGLLMLQKIFNFKRSVKNPLRQWYGGSFFWSLSRDTLQYVVSFSKENQKFLDRFKYTFCSGEIFFQTIIINSRFRQNVVNDDLRYIDWDSGKGGYPAFLDDDDYESVIKSHNLFARKINMSENNLIQSLSVFRNNVK